MSVGGLFLVISLILFFLMGVGMMVIPRADMWAHFCLVLGILLSGVPFYPWRIP